MSDKFDLSDYVPVNERIERFIERYPEGSLQSEIVELTDKRVTIRATAYRNPNDQRPGIGLAHMDIPGSTPYTRGSELENTETSAWGRALAALGFEVRRGVASAEEVRNKQPGKGDVDVPVDRVPAPSGDPAQLAPRGAQASYPRGEQTHPRTPEEEGLLDELKAIDGMSYARMELLADAVKVPKGRRANAGEIRAMLDIARKPPSVEPTGWPEPGSAAWKALSAYEQGTALAWWQKRDAGEVSEAPT